MLSSTIDIVTLSESLVNSGVGSWGELFWGKFHTFPT